MFQTFFKDNVLEVEAPIDFGRIFSIVIAVRPLKYKFEIIVNGESTAELKIPESTPDLALNYIQAKGDLELTFLGFIEPDQSPSVPIGTEITYKCPQDYVFEHDWLHRPDIRIKCLDDGQFIPPDIWPTCVYRR